MKNRLAAALNSQDYEEVARLALTERQALRKLMTMAGDKSDVLSWRAIEAMGIAAGAVAQHNTQRVRNLVQRILWSAREESGGMGWSAPELLAEIACASPKQFADIPPIIVSLHTEDEEKVFLKGVLWAIARMALAGIRDVPGAEEVVLASLDSDDPQVRGLAVRAAVIAGASASREKMQKIAADDSRFIIYEDGELVEATVAGAAGQASGAITLTS